MLLIHHARRIFESDQPFSIKFWNKDGEIISADNVICTSSYFHNDTINLKFLNSGEFRKVKVITIFELNSQEVCM